MAPFSLIESLDNVDRIHENARAAEASDHLGDRSISEFQGQMLNDKNPVLLDFVRGDSTGLAIPAHCAALRAAGEGFLTDAFRKFGSLSPDNRISWITRLEPCHAGSTGEKLILSVDYAHAHPGLPTDLFVKFSRDFADAFRDRRRHELAAEIRLAALSRLSAFPINVPAAYFADFHSESGTGILITERIAFGSGGIEPHRPKCMDHELADSLAYYRAIILALARLAAAHRSGRLSPQIDSLFPFDPEAAAAEDPIPYGEPQLRELVARYSAFAASCPQLLPASLAAPPFIARFEREAAGFLRHEAAIKRFLHADPDFIALSHFNGNIDNAWFWRDRSGALQCGLLDWQRARQMNVTYALWGALCGASLEIWDRHLEELVELFTGELHAQGGPRLDVAELKLHLDLYVATIGLAGLIETPRLVLSRLPEAADANGPLDPVFRKSEAARSFLHIFTAFLNLWQSHDFGASLNRVLERVDSARG
jgi:hypothetical protein